MKKIKIITVSSQLEEFVNKEDIKILQIDIKATDQSPICQEYFVAVIFYKELPEPV